MYTSALLAQAAINSLLVPHCPHPSTTPPLTSFSFLSNSHDLQVDGKLDNTAVEIFSEKNISNDSQRRRSRMRSKVGPDELIYLLIKLYFNLHKFQVGYIIHPLK